ncbi:hypothetical protein BC828DRAFT_401300 [Blastocladiella britannica]|nr:hypothetical protein BC828DRAFT_401300 [Blastocladiella britannica]
MDVDLPFSLSATTTALNDGPPPSNRRMRRGSEPDLSSAALSARLAAAAMHAHDPTLLATPASVLARSGGKAKHPLLRLSSIMLQDASIDEAERAGEGALHKEESPLSPIPIDGGSIESNMSSAGSMFAHLGPSMLSRAPGPLMHVASALRGRASSIGHRSLGVSSTWREPPHGMTLTDTDSSNESSSDGEYSMSSQLSIAAAANAAAASTYSQPMAVSGQIPPTSATGAGTTAMGPAPVGMSRRKHRPRALGSFSTGTHSPSPLMSASPSPTVPNFPGSSSSQLAMTSWPPMPQHDTSSMGYVPSELVGVAGTAELWQFPRSPPGSYRVMRATSPPPLHLAMKRPRTASTSEPTSGASTPRGAPPAKRARHDDAPASPGSAGSPKVRTGTWSMPNNAARAVPQFLNIQGASLAFSRLDLETEASAAAAASAAASAAGSSHLHHQAAGIHPPMFPPPHLLPSRTMTRSPLSAGGGSDHGSDSARSSSRRGSGAMQVDSQDS